MWSVDTQKLVSQSRILMRRKWPYPAWLKLDIWGETVMRRSVIFGGTLAAVVGITIGFSSAALWPQDTPRLLAADNDYLLNPKAQVSATAAWEAASAVAPIRSVTRTVVARNGDNLMGLLTRAGADRGDAYTAIQSLEGVYDPRRNLRVGHKLLITFDPDREDANGPLQLAKVELPLAFDRDVAVQRAANGDFTAQEIEKKLQRRLVLASGTINSSLFQDGREADIPAPVLVKMIQVYSFDVDFQREIREGDRFEILYERFFDRAGNVVHDGEVAYAMLSLKSTELPLYQYETTEGNLDYFNAKGQSVRKALMRTPIDGARLSSGYGKRKHPILGYTKMHTGTDFAAPRGTPIYAAGNGKVTQIGRNGGYGNYIRIRHNGTYQTAYAHMKGFARGLKNGSRVKQGQIIGYVGTTGRSTGPHLHYEVFKDGGRTNPQRLKLPSGETLAGAELKRFETYRADIDELNDSLAKDIQLAGKPEP